MRDERLQQRGRNIVDAIEAQVFEHVECHALSRSGQAADYEDSHLADVSERALPAQARESRDLICDASPDESGARKICPAPPQGRRNRIKSALPGCAGSLRAPERALVTVRG